MTQGYVFALSILSTAGLVICWGIFCLAVYCRKEGITDVLSNSGFNQVVTVMGVVAAAVQIDPQRPNRCSNTNRRRHTVKMTSLPP